MSVRLRPATPDDADALAALDRRVVDDGRGVVRAPGHSTPAARFRELVAQHVEPDAAMLVAEVDGAVVGDASVRRHPVAYCRHVALFAVQIDPPFQGRGVGRALTEAMVRWSEAHEVELLQLQVRADNHRAIRLYRSLGFHEEVRRRGFLRLADGSYVDDLGMVRVNRAPDAEKAAAAVVRRGAAGPEICVFGHPTAGWQLPKGTLEAGERPEAAVVREVEEETGLRGARVVAPLGAWTMVLPGGAVQRWHGFLLEPPAGAPDRWAHVASGSAEEDGLVFELRWVPLAWADQVVPPQFHELVHRAAAVTRAG